MPKQAASKKSPVRRRTAKKKKGTKKAPLIGFSLFIVMLMLITAMIILNHTKKSGEATAEQVSETEISTVDEEKIDGAIKHSAELLGVPSNLVTRRLRDDVINYNLQVDRGRFDLTFANMIVTGQIQLAGGIVIKGEEVSRGQAHILTVRDDKADKDYLVRISYARRDRYPSRRPRLAIIVDDFGEFSGSLLEDFLQTNINVTFAILPHLSHSREVMDKAVASGREVIVHIPMEPMDYPRNNPGINPILVEHSERDINRLMEGYLRNLPDISGANNHMGSLATTDERIMRVVLEFLQRRGLYFVDSRTTSLSVAYDMAQRMMIPSVKRDMFLDVPDSTEETLRNKIKELEKLKETNKEVVVITHCFDRDRLAILNRFIEEAIKMGFEIVPVSELFITDVPEIL